LSSCKSHTKGTVAVYITTKTNNMAHQQNISSNKLLTERLTLGIYY